MATPEANQALSDFLSAYRSETWGAVLVMSSPWQADPWPAVMQYRRDNTLVTDYVQLSQGEVNQLKEAGVIS